MPKTPQEWHCPNCDAKATTVTDKLPMHHCGGTRGLMHPLVRSGVQCKVEVVEREDYIGREMVQTDEHDRPVMAVVTTRDDGQDCTIYAPTAYAERTTD